MYVDVLDQANTLVTLHTAYSATIFSAFLRMDSVSVTTPSSTATPMSVASTAGSSQFVEKVVLQLAVVHLGPHVRHAAATYSVGFMQGAAGGGEAPGKRRRLSARTGSEPWPATATRG